jgi:hypothetical protein
MESNCEGHKKDTVGVSCCELLAWVDLNPSPALIPFKLSILRYAEIGTIGENGESFLHFPFLSRLVFSMPTAGRHRAFLTPLKQCR